MANQIKRTQSTILPQEILVKKLGKQYEILHATNIQEKTLGDETGNIQIYEYDLKIIKAPILSRNQAVGVFVELRYSKDDELALINLGLVNKTDQKYLDYRQYVDWCKVQADNFFGDL